MRLRRRLGIKVPRKTSLEVSSSEVCEHQ
jgi:hypothetical protein